MILPTPVYSWKVPKLYHRDTEAQSKENQSPIRLWPGISRPKANWVGGFSFRFLSPLGDRVHLHAIRPFAERVTLRIGTILGHRCREQITISLKHPSTIDSLDGHADDGDHLVEIVWLQTVGRTAIGGIAGLVVLCVPALKHERQATDLDLSWEEPRIGTLICGEDGHFR